MSLVKYAESELKRAGLLNKDSDYDGEAGEAVLELVKKFAGQGHSGGSAWLVLSAFDKVARFEPLTPLTYQEDEWMSILEERLPDGEGPLWQNVRKSTIFTTDHGKTWYDIDEEGRPIHHRDASDED